MDAATLASDVICGVLEKGGEHVTNYFGGFVKASAEEQEEILKGMLSPFQSSLLVTPKEIDDLTDQSAKIIGYALNLALHKNIDFDDINTFLE